MKSQQHGEKAKEIYRGTGCLDWCRLRKRSHSSMDCLTGLITQRKTILEPGAKISLIMQ